MIQDTIAEQKFDMTIEDAIHIVKGPLMEWRKEHNNQIPSLDDPNLKVREMAQAYTIIKNQKIRRMMGLDYDGKA